MQKLKIINPLDCALLLALFVFCGAAIAKEDLIKKLDSDQDGQISIKEAVAEPQLLAAFGKIDTDGNGQITSEELANSGFSLIEH